jgi:hypothetical protein
MEANETDAMEANETDAMEANETDANTTDDDPVFFGEVVVEYIETVKNETDADPENQSSIGRMIADFVVANNPGNAPDHAGPPAEAGEAKATGNATAADRKGGPDDATDANATAASSEGQGGGAGGPPAHARSD